MKILKGGGLVERLLTDVKAAGVTAAATIGTTLFDFIPTIVTVLSGILTLILIYNHFKNGRLKRQLLKLEIEKLQKENYSSD